MIGWIRDYQRASKQTKYFIWTWIIYTIAIIWTTVQAYARLEYSRTDSAKSPILNSQIKRK